MSTTVFYSLVAVVLLMLAMYSLIISRHLLRKLVAINVMSSSVFLILVAMARPADGGPDPVPHAMVLTGIVVTVGATGLAVTLVRRRFVDSGAVSLPEDDIGNGSAGNGGHGSGEGS